MMLPSVLLPHDYDTIDYIPDALPFTLWLFILELEARASHSL